MQNVFNEILRSNADDRRALYASVAAKFGNRAENIEKDLYVCWVLDWSCPDKMEGFSVNIYYNRRTL